MKRAVGYFLAFLAMVVVIFAVLISVNAHTAVLRQGEAVDEATVSKGYALLDWTPTDNNQRFTFDLEIPEGTPPLSIAVANVFTFTLYCNGELIFTRGADPSARLAVADLPLEQSGANLEILFEQPQSLVRAQIGTSSYITGASDAGAMLFAFCLGILFLMLAYSITLWMQKPGEAILVYMVILIALVTARDITQQFPLMSQGLPTMIKPGLNMALTFFVALLCAEYVLPRRFCEHPQTRLWCLLAGGLSVATCYVVSGDALLFISLILHGIYQVISAVILVYGCARRVRCAPAMLAGLAFAICSFDFYTAADQGLVVAGFLVVQGYIIQFYNVPLLLACMAAINSRFVGYYRELKRVNHELDAIVEERVLQLQQQEAQKHQLMTNVFHDLRTPLFIAMNCAERLHENGDDEQALAVLDNRLDFMNSLTQDLFTLAKLETGDLVFTEDMVDFSLLCQRQAASAKVQAGLANMKLQEAIAEACLVWGDEHRLEQIIQNLLSNAIAHTDAGGVVELELSRTAEGYVLRVSNEGAPIDPDDAAHIFDRYYRVREGGANDSSGLGLAIVSEIVKAHRGQVHFDGSEPNRPTFIVELPKLPD